MSASRRLFSLQSNYNLSHGFPLVQSLQKYFGGMEFLPIINDQTVYNKSHITGIFVLSPMYKSFEYSSTSSSITQYKWCYTVKGMEGGQYIADFSAIDGIIYALHQSLCDGILMSAKNLCYASDFIFMPYKSSTFAHVASLEPNLSEMLLDQTVLLKQHGLIHRDFPAVIISTQSGEEILDHSGNAMDFLDCDVFKHMNPFTNEHIDIYIITSINGAKRIKNRWNKYDHLKDRNIDKTLIVLSDTDAPHMIKTELISEILYRAPYNMKYMTCEGGMTFVRKLMQYELIQQLHCTLMRDCVTNRNNNELDHDSFECIDIEWNSVMNVDYGDHHCCFVVFDCNGAALC